MTEETAPKKPNHEIEVVIVNPNKVVFEGKAKRLFLPGKMAELAILPQHTPLYTELVEGVIRIEEPNGTMKEQTIQGGVARIKMNMVKILVGF